MSRPLPKLLLIFNLEGTLCKTTETQVSSIILESSQNSLILRSSLQELLRFLFIRNKLFFKVGVWTSSSTKETEIMTKKVFSNYEPSILFKYASPEDTGPKDLQRVWYNYKNYNQNNTLFIDSVPNSILPKENLVLLPPFNEDKSLDLLQNYLRFFSYHYQNKNVKDFQTFLVRIPFSIFYAEHSKPYAQLPEGESSRFA
jgi:NLI interacting factor-like phosphatase